MPLDDARTRRPHEILTLLRKRCGLTLVTAASQLGVSKSELSRIESGQRHLSRRHVAALAQLYGVDFSELSGTVLGATTWTAPSSGQEGRISPSPSMLPDINLSPDADILHLEDDGTFPTGTTVIVEPGRTILPGGCFLPRDGAHRIYRLCIDQSGRASGVSLCGAWRLDATERDVWRVVAILPA